MELFYCFVISGVFLIILEISVATFYLLVIGLVFILSGLLSLLFDNVVFITLLSVVISVLACIMIKFYKRANRKLEPTMIVYAGQQVEVVEIYPTHLRVKYSGSYWDAHLSDPQLKKVKVGDILTITKQHNNYFEID